VTPPGSHKVGATAYLFFMAYSVRLRRSPLLFCAIALLLGWSITPSQGAAAIEPQFEWVEATPESEGIQTSDLETLWKELQGRHTAALVVVRDDRIIFEKYAAGQSRSTKHYTASMAKALVGGMSLAVAMTDGIIGMDDRAPKYIPQWRSDPRKAAITIRHLGSHTSGLSDAEEGGLAHEKLPGWKGDFWKRPAPPNDPFTLARDKAPVVFEPGTAFQYSNPGLGMLGYAITSALKDREQKDLRTLLRERVMRPIGVPEKEWSIGYEETVMIDGLPLVATWGGGNCSPNAVARIGRLMLRKGEWQGRRVLAEGAVESVTSDAGTPGFAGIGWWSNNEGSNPKMPRDAFWGSGAGHQVLLVIPSLRLIVVRFGTGLDSAMPYDEALRNHFFTPLMSVLNPAAKPRANFAPYPPSSVIGGIKWSAKETIVRRAKGSDNWPITWADDDNLYTAYGDGNGFEPFLPQKLSLGLARISGPPIAFTGVNLRSPSLEQKGDGKAGKKASGILCVEGVLYLWARNAGNSQLGWSADHGANWTWCDWKFTNSFGCPTFLNFGRDYAGARDRFVYVYSPDVNDAYSPADQFVLAREDKTRIRNREDYEFFQGIDTTGAPGWSRRIEERSAVFHHAGGCYRSGISYSRALNRYLWCQTLPGGDARFGGGFGIFDAPEPWGPWTTVFYTEQWDVGPGESSSLPPKWMSADGQTIFLVFSGDDSFSLRKATLHLNQTGDSLPR